MLFCSENIRDWLIVLFKMDEEWGDVTAAVAKGMIEDKKIKMTLEQESIQIM